MTDGERSGGAVSEAGEELLDRLRDVLSRHPVSFALLFGSVARGDPADDSDVDVAVEFEDVRPEDDGYSDVYLRLLTDLDTALPFDVDVVDVHSMKPRFARVALDSGTVILGPDDRREHLVREIAGEHPSVAEARDRVAGAADRLAGDVTGDRGR